MSVEQLVHEAEKQGHSHAVLADINNTSAVFDFVSLCQNKNIKPVVGVELRNGQQLRYLCIAKNRDGFSSICKYMTEHNLAEKEYPLKASPLAHVYTIYPLEVFEQGFAFGKTELVGIRLSELNKLWKYNYASGRISHTKTGAKVPVVLLQPVTFLHKQGYNLHRLLRAIDDNCLLSKLSPDAHAPTDEVPYSPYHIQERLHDYPEILTQTQKLFGNCTFEFETGQPQNKKLFSSSKEADLELLTKLAWDGMRYRYGTTNAEAKKRIEKELKIIDELAFSSYFLITWDIIRYARSRGYFHVGRGSGANSIVAYCLQITDVDPIELDLYFERFINPHRTSPPDFDIDFSWDERDEIIDYVFKRYGSEYVCLLATYVTFKDRSAYRELGKVFGLPKAEIDAMVEGPKAARHVALALESSPVPTIAISQSAVEIPQAESHQPITQNTSFIPATVQQQPTIVPPGVKSLILKYAQLLEDFPNYLSIHAGGILISEKPLSYFTALLPMPKGFPICQFDMYVAEDVGFAKFDVLSQRGLGHIKECVDIVWQNCGVNVDAHAIQRFKNDPLIRKQVQRHETMGCFYIESPAMRQLIWKLRCDDYLTLVAASSIIRPGVASSGMMKAYIERHHDPGKVVYIHPKMKDLLQETYGVMVYQEDVIKVAHHFAGLSLAESDVLRRAMSGKYRSRAAFQRIIDTFFENCKNFGYPDDIAKEVWRQIESFSGYSFSKAHSASFAVESYQSLYLKTYYPREFMVAVINNFGGFYKTEFYVHEARRCGACIEAPDINMSHYLTHIQGTTIWLGWVHIKGLERKLAEWIIAEAAIKPFHSFDDFCRRVPTGLELLIILIRVGAFRGFGIPKKELLWQAHLKHNTKSSYVATGDLFEIPEEHFEFPALVHDPLEDAYDELELIGFALQSPFNLAQQLPTTATHALNMQQYVGKVVDMVGYMVTLKPTRTKKGDRMVFGYFLDERGEFFDTVHFPQSCLAYPFSGWGIYQMRGLITEEYNHCALQVTWMHKLSLKGDPRGM